jgi:hypothetical protein
VVPKQYIYDAVLKKENGRRVAHAVFLNLFTVCSWCKGKFVICPFVDKETNGSYAFANGLNRLNRLAHLCLSTCCYERTGFDRQYLGGDSGHHHTGA